MRLSQLISTQTIKKRKLSASELAYHPNAQQREQNPASKDPSGSREYKVKMVEQDDLSQQTDQENLFCVALQNKY